MRNQKVFGIFDSSHCLIDTSETLRGAMIHARRNGYSRVGVRFVMTGGVFELARLTAGPRGGAKTWARTMFGRDSAYTGER